jgi:hypothetical protein
MNGLFLETHGIPRKEHVFRGNTKTVPSLFRETVSERNFDGNPTAKSIHSRGDMHVKQMLISSLTILRDRVKNIIFMDLLCVRIFWIQNSNLLEKPP